MATITTPAEGFTGSVVGVDFKDGVGETADTAALEYFERQGYTIEVDEPAFPEGKPSDKWKVDQLKAYAEANTIDLTEAKTKDDILALVNPPAPPA